MVDDPDPRRTELRHTDGVPLEDAIRRNRRRIIAITTMAMLNYWIVASLLTGIMGWGLVFKVDDDADVTSNVILGSSVGAGLLITAVLVIVKLRSIRPRVVRSLGAVEIEPGELPRVENLLEGLAIAAGTPPVRAALLAEDAPNALAVGRRPSDTAIVVTSGLVEQFTRDELEAVLAAEMCAVRRLDTAMQTATLACTSGAVAVHHLWRDAWKDPRAWLMIVLTWPTMACAELLRRSVLRSADFGADEMAVTLTRHPEALRSALVKLRHDEQIVAGRGASDSAPLWFEPIPDADGSRAAEFRRMVLAPSLEERIGRLSRTAGSAGPTGH